MGRESCLWTLLQRELKGMCLLQEAALTRLDSLGFQWTQQVQIQPLSPYTDFVHLVSSCWLCWHEIVTTQLHCT